MQQPNIDQRSMAKRLKIFWCYYGCNPILWTGNKKAQAFWPGFSAAPHSSAALTIVTAHYKKGVPFIWEEKRSLSIRPMFRSMPLSGSLAACLMIYGPTLQSQKCKLSFSGGLQNGNRIKRKREQPLWLLSLFMWLSSCVALWVWILAEWVHHWENMLVRISGNKQIIRTLFPRGKSGSDYICLVQVVSP